MLKVFRRLGVREVWICLCAEGGSSLFSTPDGRYKQASTSHWLPFLKSEELTQWAYRDDLPTDSELRYQFRAWVVEVLAPAKGGEPLRFPPKESRMATATLPNIEDPWQQIPATWSTFQDLLERAAIEALPDTCIAMGG